MRMKAAINGHPTYRKAILFDDGRGVYLFLFDSPDDVDGLADEWYPSREAAIDSAHEMYGVSPEAWSPLDDPLPGMRHDREAPIPVGPRTRPPADGSSLERASPELRARVAAALHEHGSIRAMQLYVCELGVGLAEAQAALARLRAEQPPGHEDR